MTPLFASNSPPTVNPSTRVDQRRADEVNAQARHLSFLDADPGVHGTKPTPASHCKRAEATSAQPVNSGGRGGVERLGDNPQDQARVLNSDEGRPAQPFVPARISQG
jgi:hypothetical protein